MTDANFDVTVKIEVIFTTVENRDNQKGADFFEIEKYPEMAFKSPKIQAAGKPD